MCGDEQVAEVAFTGGMDPGVVLSGELVLGSGETVPYPGYLSVREVVELGIADRVDPSALPAECALVFGRNVYITDSDGNVAYIHCRMRHVDGAAAIRRAHPEYRKVGGRRASRESMDAGHLGISLGQHPSIAMEQDSFMNRYGAWRRLERSWDALARGGSDVLVRGVFVQGDSGTYAPFWCVEEIVDDGEPFEYILENDACG